MNTRVIVAILGLSCAMSMVCSSTVSAQTSRSSANMVTPSTAVVPVKAFAPAIPLAGHFTGHISATTTQVIVVSARTWHSTTAMVTIYNSDGHKWIRLLSTPARLGYGGLVPAHSRVQDTGTTPAGQFGITETFGLQVNPGTAMPYVPVTNDDWWVEDRTSEFYNQMHRASTGGFRVSQSGFNSSEHLATMGAQYDYVAVINFNRPNPVIGHGAGIFLHVYGQGLTAGCVSVAHSRMRSILRWLNPSRHPRIIIGPAAWLNAA